MAWFDSILLVPVVLLLWRAFKSVRRSRRMSVAWWMALYFTLPLAIYDWLY